MPIIKCYICKKEIHKPPSQVRKQNFCGTGCYYIWRKTLVGELNCHWKGGKITKTCVRCGKEFQVYPSMKHHTHCSLLCANRDIACEQKGISNKKKGQKGIKNALYRHGYMNRGKLNKNYKGENGITKLNAQIRGLQDFQDWRKSVFIRDNYTCQDCLKHGGDLEAHHIKPFAKYPNLRFDTNNGITLCKSCHKIRHKK